MELMWISQCYTSISDGLVHVCLPSFFACQNDLEVLKMFFFIFLKTNHSEKNRIFRKRNPHFLALLECLQAMGRQIFGVCRPSDVIPFLKAMTNSLSDFNFQCAFSQTVFLLRVTSFRIF